MMATLSATARAAKVETLAETAKGNLDRARELIKRSQQEPADSELRRALEDQAEAYIDAAEAVAGAAKTLTR